MPALLYCYVERRIKTQPSGRVESPRETFRRTLRRVQQMHGRTIAGHTVTAMLTDEMYAEIDEPCIVPDFGHNYRCECKQPESNGVLRNFGVTLCVSGQPDDSILRTWQIDEDTRLIVCSMTGPVTQHGAPLTPVDTTK